LLLAGEDGRCLRENREPDRMTAAAFPFRSIISFSFNRASVTRSGLPADAGFTMNTMLAVMVCSERAVFPHERPVLFNLSRGASRLPSERIRHPRGDLLSDLERLIRRLVEKAESPDEDVRQGQGHLLMDRDVDLRPHVGSALHDRVAGPRGFGIS